MSCLLHQLSRCAIRIRLASVVFACALLLCLPGKLHAQCSSPANAIVAENCLTGNPASEWDVGVGSTGDLSIQGFATDISVNQGATIAFKVNTPASAYTINIYRVGYYGGQGARKVATITPSAHLPQTQPACATDSTTGLIDCGNWAVSASWQVPATATSGVYFAHLTRSDNGGDSHIVFIVRNDASTSDIMYQTADESWQAYNYYGAGSLYSQATPVFDLTDRSYKVSYNRPVLTRGFNQEWDTWIFGAEFAMIQWMESNGYDITYFTGVDADRNGALIKKHKIYMDSGHDEYWSGPQRANVQAARDAGVNLAFFSGNTMFWKTRWENSIDGSNTADRTMVCYKETLAFAKLDAQHPTLWTGTFRDPSFSPPADAGVPENSLTGTLFMVNGTGPDNDGSLQIKVPAADGKMRFWRNTAAATLAPTATYTLPAGSLGYEWDLDVDNGFRPAGAFDLSTVTYPISSDYLLDYGATYGAGTATHHLMLYRAPSGALVFSAGTIDWSWGLNSNHDNLFSFKSPAPDLNMQQATVNLFADMGVQPHTTQPGIVAATASSDNTPPTSTITSPAAGATINTGSSVTISGNANDAGGVVAGVEVSTDKGVSWHPATGRANWTYLWTPSAVSAATTLLSRAVDDSANLETPGSGVTLNVQPQTCPCTIWNASKVPTSVDSGDATSIEVGVKFRADSDGSVLGVRFYKSAKNTGSHVGHIWTSSGTLLGTATFTGESSSGWQQATFSAPIAVQANTTYVVSYYTPTGHYAADSYFFTQSGVDNAPLHALANGVDGGNGVFVYPSSNTTGGFPASTNNSANYWVDLVYTSSNTYTVSGTISGSGGAGTTITLSGAENLTTVADSFGHFSFSGVINGTYTVTPANTGVGFTPASQSVTVNSTVVTGVNFAAVVTNPLSISGTISNGAGAAVTLAGSSGSVVTADSTGNYTFGGLLNGSYTLSPAESGYLFTPGTQTVALSGASVTGVNFQGQLCNCVSIWQPSAIPALPDSNDATPVEVGVKFRTDTPGVITALRFYKAATNTGTHVGHIWTSAGVQLGTGTFTNETAAGWQQMTFATPVSVSANTTYVASYYAPAGHYSADTNYFATTGVDVVPLHALANGVDGPNGTYTYTSSQTGGFPTSTYASTNYWVDVLFAGAQAYTLSGTVGAPGTTVFLGGATGPSTTADTSGNYSFNVFPGTYSVTPSLAHFAFVPGSQTIPITSGSVGQVNFSVPALCPCTSIWSAASLPATIDSGDTLPYELGLKFRADTDGYILGVRFYKAASNTGSHVGHLWASSGSTGTPLSSATFSAESASGWQQAIFPAPVAVSANTTYIASYFAPGGHYSIDTSYFSAAGVDTPPLHALATGVDGQNGVYLQSATGGMPVTSYNAGNYWVDVIYATSSTHSIGGVVTGPGGAGTTITLTGAASAVATADAGGHYSISGLADGTYLLTPSQSGYSFSPASTTVTLSGAHNLQNNFVSAAPTFIVSGTVTGGPQISVVLTGTGAPVTVTADASGNYSFPNVPNGTYTLAPSSTGYLITPASRSITVGGASLSALNFSATPVSYAISGSIAGGAGATVNLAGSASSSTVADSAGNYTFSATPGTYTLTPAKIGLVFTPASLGTTIAGASVTGVNFAVPATCPCNAIWQPTSTPTAIDDGDNGSIEVGFKFRSDTAGVITGIRFYKSAANVGSHLGNLWSATGTLLASAAFTGETGSGWQQVFFATPVVIAANTTYVASYFAPSGHYSGDSGFFTSAGVDAPPLHALANGVDGSNGVFSYASASSFPTSSATAGNYWVDVIYERTSNVSGSITGPGSTGATITLSGTSVATTTTDANGKYAFPAMANGTYRVTPSNTGTTFTPTSQAITVAGADLVVPSFTSVQPTFNISGVISGPGGSGATVSLSGASSAMTTASSTGAYSFPAVLNGSFVVTPANPGYVFSPTSRAGTMAGKNQTVSFSSTAQTYTLSGVISGTLGSGATITLRGAASKSVTASSTGTYSFAGLPNGSYTVTATKTYVVFTPTSQAVVISGANNTANFTAASQTYTITGVISGAGGSAATINLTGAASATTTTTSTGAYTFTGLANGAYTLTPTKTGYIFSPASSSLTINNANRTFNFTAAPLTIGGTIAGPGGPLATVTLTGPVSATTTASSTGTYSFSGLVPGTYTYTPTKAGFTFSPASRTLSITTASRTTENFNTVVYTVSGTISGTSGAGATVQLASSTATVTTTASSSGVYKFSNITNGTYTVTPSASQTGSVFTPASKSVTVNQANVTANFAGKP